MWSVDASIAPSGLAEEPFFAELGRRIRTSASPTATYVVEDGTNARIVRVAPTVDRQPTPGRRSQILLKS